MNRVQRFAERNAKRRNNVCFALQILQRPLASSPAAIHQSLKRRRERLEVQLAEARIARRAGKTQITTLVLRDDELSEIEEFGQDEV